MQKAFVILAHSGLGPLHYDLMLEQDQALATWRLETDPARLREGESIGARKLKDHRVAYLSYEGPVSRGRGEVVRSDGGTYHVLGRQPQGLSVELNGKTVSGRYELTCSGRKGDRWTLKRLARG